MTSKIRNLVVILGDQLDRHSPLLEELDPEQDRVWMAEVHEESRHVWSHKSRTALFLSAMRHFWAMLEDRGIRVLYRQLEDPENRGSFDEELRASLDRLQASAVQVLQPGSWRVLQILQDVTQDAGVPLDILPDPHFLCSLDDFEEHARGRKQLRMEYFYREMRQRYEILLDPDGKPCGGKWNLDPKNRESFDAKGPPSLFGHQAFPPDELTQAVFQVIEEQLPDLPGSLEAFDWPVTREQALEALDDFLQHRLPLFGKYQDALWTDEPWLFHSRLSAALNLKLLNPREVITCAEEEYRQGRAPLNSVEGFIRQILGWREYVRGIYWRCMPEYLTRNALDAQEPLPAFYWTGETRAHCLNQVIDQTLEFGYAHHIQRLMVTGLFTLLLGTRPQAVHEWYLAVYVDAVEWVELPNTLGMSQYGDGGLLGSKPYVATGKYIQRMSNYCGGCPFDPAESLGPQACPFTTLYWDFLIRHEKRFEKHPRMALQVRNLKRLEPEKQDAIQKRSQTLRKHLAVGKDFPED